MWVCCMASQWPDALNTHQLPIQTVAHPECGPDGTHLAGKISLPCPQSCGSLLADPSLREGSGNGGCRWHPQTDLFFQTCLFNIFSTKSFGVTLLEHLHPLSIFPFGPGWFFVHYTPPTKSSTNCNLNQRFWRIVGGLFQFPLPSLLFGSVHSFIPETSFAWEKWPSRSQLKFLWVRLPPLSFYCWIKGNPFEKQIN